MSERPFLTIAELRVDVRPVDPFERAVVIAIQEAVRLRREREAKMPEMRRKPAA